MLRPNGLESLRIGMVTFGSILQPRSGLPSRARAVAEDLADLGAFVYVLSVGETRDETITGRRGSIVVKAHRRRFLLGWSPGLGRQLRLLSRSTDVLVLESAQFFPICALFGVRKSIVWDTTECETLHYMRYPKNLESAIKLRIWRLLEGWSVKRASVVVAVSREEERSWRTIFPKSSQKLLTVVHRPLHAVDGDQGSGDTRAVGETLPRDYLVFVGNTLAKQNRVAVEWMRDQLVKELPSAVNLILVGAGTEELSGVGESGARIYGLGEVSDLGPVLSGAALAVAPLSSGAGVKTKVLDYVAAGVEVVGTRTAFEGLRGCPGLIEAELDDFPRRIVEVLQRRADEGDRADLKMRQRSWLERNASPEVTRCQWVCVLSLIAEREGLLK